jgi:sugar/nucleoside kinase (ribokinase family)
MLETRKIIMDERPGLLFAGTVFCDMVFSIDGLPAPGSEIIADQFIVSAGGTANRAVAAARLGARSVISAWVGDDPLGAVVMAQLREEPNLDISRLKVSAGMRTPVTVSLADRTDRTFITYEEPRPAPTAVQAAETTFRCCHISVASAGVAREIPAWAGRLREQGTTIVGGVGWDGTGTWSPELLDRIQGVDVLCANEVEAVNYTGAPDAATAARELARHVATAVVTRGADGVIAAEAGTSTILRVPGIPVRAIDPTGAGDVFVAALMVALAEDWPLEQGLKMATAAAAISVGRLGGASAAPDRAEVAGFLADLPASSGRGPQRGPGRLEPIWKLSSVRPDGRDLLEARRGRARSR